MNENQTRGCRNNNPLNIKFGKSRWVGKITENKKDETFEEFDTLVNGLRAAIKLIQNYIKSSFNTVDKIVRRWCPDETQDAYVKFVESTMEKNLEDYDKKKPLHWHDFDDIFVLVSAMAWQESKMKIDRALFMKAWEAVDTHNQSNRKKAAK